MTLQPIPRQLSGVCWTSKGESSMLWPMALPNHHFLGSSVHDSIARWPDCSIYHLFCIWYLLKQQRCDWSYPFVGLLVANIAQSINSPKTCWLTTTGERWLTMNFKLNVPPAFTWGSMSLWDAWLAFRVPCFLQMAPYWLLTISYVGSLHKCLNTMLEKSKPIMSHYIDWCIRSFLNSCRCSQGGLKGQWFQEIYFCHCV